MQQLKVGSSLQGGKYKIEKVLGQGGFGITYLATQELLDRKVCIKEFFFKEYCERDEATSHVTLGTQSNHELVERFMVKFLKEARTISQLDHRNIIKIHDIFKENNTAYYVMDYVEGESLNDMVNRRGALPEKEAVAYIERVADALKYIHQQNINHLDIKPSNIMIRQGDYRVILIDFGLSKQYDAQGGQTSTTPVGISHGYAPMEQYKQGGVSTFSPQTDIYALGATLYKLVTGNTPPQAMDILDEGLPSLPSCVSPSVAEAIKKAMQPRKVDRPKDILEFLEVLNVTNHKQSRINNNHDKKETEFISYQQSHAIEETKIAEIQKNSPETNSFKTDKEKVKPTITILPSEDDKMQNSNNVGKWILIGMVGIIIGIICYSKSEAEKYKQQQNEIALQVEQEAEAEKEAERLKQEAEQKRILEDKAREEVERKSLGMSEKVYEYLQGARNGSAIAQYYLGWSYHNGNGVRQNYTEAVKWYRKSAEQGDADAQCSLGYCYNIGQGVKQNYAEAVKWYRKSAEQGDRVAQNNLGICYENGHGVDKDFTEAVKWYSKSANQGLASAQYSLGWSYYYGNGVVKDYTKAVKWWEKAVSQNHVEATYKLGYCYYEGYGVDQDFKKAEDLWKKAADSNHTEAQRMLKFLRESNILNQ